MVFRLQYLRSERLSLGTVVANLHPVGILLQPMLHQSIVITIVSILRNLHVHRRTVETNLLATSVDEMGHGSKGTHIVVHHHTGAVHARTDSIIEDERHAIVHQLLEVGILLGVLRLRNDDATHLILIEVIADGNLLVVSLIALRHHHTIASRPRFLLDAREHRHEVIVYELGHDDTNHLHRLHLAVAQSLADDVRIEVMFTGIRLYTLLLDSTDTRAVLQRSAHRGDAYAEVASNIFHCYDRILIHIVFSYGAKLGKYPISCIFFIDINQAKAVQTFAL